MKFSIQINQYAAQEGFEELTISDLSIFDLFTFMQGSNSIISKIVDNKKYVLMHYKYIITQLPVLKIKTRQGVYKKLAKLEEVGLIERLNEGKKNSDSYYCSGVNYDLMFIKHTDKKVVTQVTNSNSSSQGGNSSSQGGNSSSQGGNSSSQGGQPQLPNSELELPNCQPELHNKVEVEEEINKEEIKESVGDTHTQVRKSLNQVQESVGNKSVDPSETSLTANVKNKYTHLTAEAKKELWTELRDTVWKYAKSRNWLDDNYPKRWEMLELAIKDFVGHHIDKGNWESEFFNYERKLIQWIDKDVLRESSIPFSVWNKTKEDLQKNTPDEKTGFVNYYSVKLMQDLKGKDLRAYEKHLIDNCNFTKTPHPIQGIIWKDSKGKRVN